ncbi:MAG: radical SAM protein [Candidatus Omnitrophota bacterium]
MRVLFVYPNNMGYTRIPPGISILVSILKKNGHEVKVFDTSFYKLFSENDDDIRTKTHQVRFADLNQYGVTYQAASVQDVLADCTRVIKGFNPDLIAFSVMTEDCADFSQFLAAGIRKAYPKMPFIFGGIAVTMSPEEYIAHPFVDVINIGEGEDSLLEFITKSEKEEDISGIKNMWIKRDGQIIKNEVRPLKDLNEIPIPDFDEFSEKHFYRPIDGVVYRMAMVEFTRGCPRRCTYCNNHVLQNLYQGKGAYIRRKSIERVMQEMEFLKKKHNLTMIFFVDDDFTLLPLEEMREFTDQYKERIGLPFVIQVAAPTISREKVVLLRDAGCVTFCMSIESGNDFIKNKVFDRYISNDQLVKAFATIKAEGVRVSSTNIIGNPFETRKMVFDTIEMNKKTQPDGLSNCFLVPYKGTRIREMALKEKFIRSDMKLGHGTRGEPILDMPQISKNELKALQKMFPFYVRLPRVFFPVIRFCEKDNIFSGWVLKILSLWLASIEESIRNKRLKRYNMFMKHSPSSLNG